MERLEICKARGEPQEVKLAEELKKQKCFVLSTVLSCKKIANIFQVLAMRKALC